MAKIKVGILGTGGMANGHAGHYAKIPGVALTACYDLDTDRARAFAEKHGFAHVAESVDETIDRCDAISIVTPDAFHAELSLKVLKADRHLLCEKPLTTNLPDARKVARAAQAAAKRAGVIHMTNFSHRQHPPFLAAMKMVQRGDLGEIRHVIGHYHQSWLVRGTWGEWTEPAWVWRLATARGSGGVLADLGCHLMDFASGILGDDIAAIQCTLGNYPKIDPDTGKKHTRYDGVALDANDTAALHVTFAGGALGVLQTSRWITGRPNAIGLSIHGTQGAVEMDSQRYPMTLRTCMGKDITKGVWKEKKLKPVPLHYQTFIKAIKTGTPPQPDIVRGAQVQSWLDAAVRSDKTDKTVKPACWL